MSILKCNIPKMKSAKKTLLV